MAGVEGLFIVDASSIVRAALTDGSAAATLLDALLDRGLLVSSAAILDEVEEVLQPPEVSATALRGVDAEFRSSYPRGCPTRGTRHRRA
jgi:hypothetical protein